MITEFKRENGLVGDKTKLRKIDSPILTTFLQSPIFTPSQKGVSREFDNYRKIVINPSSKEEVTISGPVLDMNKDFAIWATVLKKIDETGQVKVSIPENELLLNIGYSKSNLNNTVKKAIENKIENMMKVTVKIVIDDKDKNRDCTYFINIFTTGKWDRIKKVFEFQINEDLFDAYTNMRWKALDLEYYHKIKTEYAKALFCFYESHSNKMIPFKREKLLERLGLENYSRKNNAYGKLKKAHEQLEEIGFLKNFKCEKNTDNNYYYTVSKVEKEKREFGGF
jgi:hypothetical protein